MAAVADRKGVAMPIGCCEEDECETLVIGLPGPPGPRGPQGTPGGGGGGTAEYYHVQSTPSSSWTIAHSLNKQIVGAIVYSGDLGIQYDGVFVEQLDANTCRLWVSPPLAGIARIF